MAKKEEEMKKLEEELKSLEEQLKRAVADYRNLEKRVTDDAASIVQYSRAQLIVKLLPALDSLDQAVAGAAESEAESAWLKGVLISIKQLRQALSEEGLVEIEAMGDFDPTVHEAVDIREGEEGKILEVVQRGYILSDKVVRPARVVVGKTNPEEMTEEAKEEVGGKE